MFTLDLLVLGLLKAGADALAAEWALWCGGSLAGLCSFTKVAVFLGCGVTSIAQILDPQKGLKVPKKKANKVKARN